MRPEELATGRYHLCIQEVIAFHKAHIQPLFMFLPSYTFHKGSTREVQLNSKLHRTNQKFGKKQIVDIALIEVPHHNL
jgi:hypothetical protein